MTDADPAPALAWLTQRFGPRARLNEPLSRHTSFRIGGPADALVRLSIDTDIADLLAWSQASRVPVVVLGNGTNVLASDAGFRGVVLCIVETAPIIGFDDAHITTGAGCRLSRLARACADRGLSGIEFAAGIPGALGGAVAMNAGAWGRCLADVLVRVEGLDRLGRPVHWPAHELALAYRHSRLLDEFAVLTGVELELTPRPRPEIEEAMRDLAARRRASQPLSVPSAGSVFRNPPGESAGRLIEAAGCKGLRIGDALVSERHANFFVNAGRATSSDVASIIAEVRERVARRFGVELETEITFLGEFDPALGRQPGRSVE